MPARFGFAGEVVDAFAEDRGRLAACWPEGGRGEGRATFWDLRDRSRALAGRLHEAGVRAGENVAIVLPVGVEWAVAHLAVLRLGAVAAPVDPRRDDLEARVHALAATVAVAACEIPGVRERLAPSGLEPQSIVGGGPEKAPTPSEHVALLRETAVSGGSRRSVAHTAAWIHAQRHAGAYWLDLRRTDLLWIAEDSAESLSAAIGTFAAWSLGVPVTFAPSDRGWETLRRHPVSVLLADVVTCRRLADEPGFSSTHLRHCAGLGAPLPGLDESWREVTGLPLHGAFGIPDCPILLAHLRGLPVRPGSVGRPFPGHDVCVVAAGGEEASPGEAGEIVVRGRPPTLSIEGARADSFRTGVQATRDEQGYFRVMGDAESLA